MNTQEYDRRPDGVGFLIVGLDHTGPHRPTPVRVLAGQHLLRVLRRLNRRVQSAKTYPEKHEFESLAGCTYPPISHVRYINMYVYARVCRQFGRPDPPQVARPSQVAPAGQGAHDQQKNLSASSAPVACTRAPVPLLTFGFLKVPRSRCTSTPYSRKKLRYLPPLLPPPQRPLRRQRLQRLLPLRATRTYRCQSSRRKTLFRGPNRRTRCWLAVVYHTGCGRQRKEDYTMTE